MTPDALKAMNDPSSPEAKRESRRAPKKDKAIDEWQKARMKLIQKLVDEEVRAYEATSVQKIRPERGVSSSDFTSTRPLSSY